MSILSLFLPLTPSRFQADLWKTEALCVHFSAQASKTHARGSSRWGTLCYSYVFLGEISVETFCSLLNWIVCLFLWSSKSSLYILDTSPLSGRYMICKYSFPFCGLSFYFFHGVPWITNFFNFGKCSLFLFCGFWLTVPWLRNHCLSQGHLDWLLYSLVILSSFYRLR